MRFVNRFCLIMMVLLSVVMLADSTTFAQKKSTARRKTVKKAPTAAAAAPAAPVAPIIPANTDIKIRLTSDIDTATAQDGDKFSAVVIDAKYADAKIEGHIAAVKQSGKLKGQTALALTFDTITFANGASATLAAQLTKVYDSESAKKVDAEGNIASGDKTKTTTIRTGGGAVAGAIIGAAAGGGKGAAIGAILGAAAGAGSTYIQGANKIKLDRGTEILITTLK